MSKSSSNNDINLVFIERLISAIGDLTTRIEELNKSLFESDFFKDSFESNVARYNSGEMTSSNLKKIFKDVFKDFESGLSTQFNISGTKRLHAAEEAFAKAAANKYAGVKIEGQFKEQMFMGIKQFVSSAVFEAIRGAQRGEKSSNLYFTNTLDNEKLTGAYKEFAKKIGVSIDSAQYKLITFFQGAGQKAKKVLSDFGKDLIDGLAKSKWVGGALQDTFRLIGLLGANWLTKFGQLGRILGGAFYVAMSTAGPLLVKLFLQGIGKLFTSLPRMLGNLGRGVWNSALRTSVRAGGPLGDFVTAGAGQKLAAGGRLAGAGLAAGALGTGAFFAGRESYRSFKQGDKVGGSAFGIGAAGLGVAAVAALVAGIAAPVTLIAATIGGIAVGVGALWKNREKILEHYKKHKEFYDKVLDVLDKIMPAMGVLRRVALWWFEHFGGHTDAPDSYGRTNNFAQKVANAVGIQDTEQVQTIEGMGINRAGHATNLIKLNPDQASKALKAYYENFNEQALRAYDWFKPGEFNPSLFPNDASIRNAKGEAILVPTYRGHREDFNAYNAALAQVGLSSLQLGGAMQTAGRKSTTHVKGSKHNNIQGLVSDYSPSWTTWNQWKTGMAVLSPMGKDRQFDFYFEGYVDPRMRPQDRRMTKDVKDLDTPEFQAAVYGRHFHVQRQSGYENLGRSGDPLINIENSKVRAQQQRLDIIDIAKKLEPEVYKDYERKKGTFYKGAEGEEQAKKYIESQMLQYGYYFDDKTQQWMKKKSGGIFGIGADNREGLIVRDQSGNYKFEAMQTKMENFEAGSTNGR